jgi:hypothetical protein
VVLAAVGPDGLPRLLLTILEFLPGTNELECDRGRETNLGKPAAPLRELPLGAPDARFLSK